MGNTLHQRKADFSTLEEPFNPLNIHHPPAQTDLKRKVIIQTDDSLELADELYKLSQTHMKSESYEIALTSLCRAKEIYISHLGANHTCVADTLTQIARTYHKQKNYDLAVENILKSIQIKIINYGPESLQVADCYWNLALLYEDKQSIQESIYYYKQFIQIYQKIFHESHINLYESYKRLGLACYHLGHTGEALEHLNKALDIYRDYFAPDRFEEGNLLSDIGIVQYAKRDFKEAIRIQEIALRIFLKTTWENHPLVAVTYNNLSLAHLALNECKKSLKYQKKSLAIRLKNQDMKLQATAYENIGQVYKKISSNENAISAFKKSLLLKKLEFDLIDDENNAKILLEHSEMDFERGKIELL